MISIRKNTFETNSSSTHSLSIPGSEDIEEILQNLSYYEIEGKDDLYVLLGRVEELKNKILKLIENN